MTTYQELIQEQTDVITKLTERVDELFYENLELKKQLETLWKN